MNSVQLTKSKGVNETWPSTAFGTVNITATPATCEIIDGQDSVSAQIQVPINSGILSFYSIIVNDSAPTPVAIIDPATGLAATLNTGNLAGWFQVPSYVVSCGRFVISSAAGNKTIYVFFKGRVGTSAAVAEIPNRAPSVANGLVDQSVNEDSPLSYQFASNSFSDADGDTLTYTAALSSGAILPTWLTFTPATRTFSGTPLNADVGVITVRVTASDGVLTVTDDFTITVANTNDAPTVANTIPDRAATVGIATSYQVPINTFLDVDAGATLTYSATKSDNSALPAWLSFNTSTRTFSGTPAGGDVGTVSVKVTCSDGTASVSDTFDIVVGQPVVQLLVMNKNRQELRTMTALTGAGNTLLSSLVKSPVDMAIDPVSGKVYYASTDGSAGGIRRCDANGANDTLILSNNSGQITQITIDFTNSLIYYVKNVNQGTAAGFDIRKCSLTGTSDTLILNTGFSKSNCIRYNGGFLYYTLGTSVRRIAVNGTGDTSLFSGIASEPTALAIHPSGPATGVYGVIGTQLRAGTNSLAGLLKSGLTGPTGICYDATNNKIYYCMSTSGTSRSVRQTDPGASQDDLIYQLDPTGSGSASADPWCCATGVSVNGAPTVANALPAQSLRTGVAYSYQVPSNTFSDPGDTLSYSASLSGGAALPSWLSFNNSTRTFSGTPLLASGHAGTITVTVTVVDSQSLTVATNMTINVSGPTILASIFDINDIIAVEDVNGTGTLRAGWSTTLTTPPYMLTYNPNNSKAIFGSLTGQNISSLTAAGTEATILAATGNPTFGVAYDSVNDKIYFTNGSDVKKMDGNGSNVSTLHNGSNLLYGLRVDVANSLVYYCDRGSNQINRMTTVGGSHTNLITGRPGQPYDLELDVTGGKIYWSEIAPGTMGVYRANLDGSSVELLFSYPSNQPLGLTISDGYLYHINSNLHTVIRSDKNGANPVTIYTYTAGAIADPHSITIY